MGFSEKWMGWLEACVFSGRVLALVNGSPTKEVNMQKGPQGRGSIGTFPFFLIVAEGLGSLITRAVGQGIFLGCDFDNSCNFSYFQYTDDAILMDKTSFENM